MSEQVSDDMSLKEFLPGVLRYAVLAILYIICFLYLYSNSTQFILFIVLFILNFFTIVFLYADFLSFPSIFGENIFTQLSVFSIFITLILNIATFGMILAVFDYGKKSTNDYGTYTMTPQNMQLIADFKGWYYWYMAYMGFFAFFVIYSHADGRLRLMLQNMIGVILSLAVISIGSYQCYLAVEFVRNRIYKRQLYQ